MRNIPLLIEVMVHIHLYPELHDQSWYFVENDCGTASCFGGWACALSGYTPIPVEFDDCFGERVVTPDGPKTTGQAAQELLGLTLSEATTLFHVGNTAAMLELMVTDLIHGNELQWIGEYRNECVSQRA